MMIVRTLKGAVFISAFILSGCVVSKEPREYVVAANETTLVRETPAETRERLLSTSPSEVQQKPTPSTSRSTVPRIGPGAAGLTTAEGGQPPAFGVETVDTVVPPLAVPDFIDLVFGQMLKTPYVPGPGVANNKQVIQLRTSGEMTADVFYGLIAESLKQYGLRVMPEDGVYKIIQDSDLQSRLPRFVRSRARAETPAGLRPVVQFVELNAIRAQDMSGILKQAFDPRDGNLRIESDNAANYIILSGLPEDVDAALSIIYEMDELRYAGTQVERYTPIYWGVQALSREIMKILTAEGWQTSTSEAQQKPVLLLSIEQSNDLLIFTRTPKARTRVNYWIQQLDRPAREGNEAQMFVYNVKNLDAQVLADTANDVLAAAGSSGGGRSTRARRAAAAIAAATAQQNGQAPPDEQSASPNGGRIVVDTYGNRLIFSGTAREYERVLPLMESLDQPAPEVMIEVMIAQITLSDSISSGVEWTVQNLSGSAFAGNLSGISAAQSGLGLGGGGLDVSVFPSSDAIGIAPGDVTVDINAFAQNSQVNVLSTPRLVARSGSSAQVQVGAEIPILTAQRTPTGGFGGNTNVDVISSVAYRSTGIILQIEPIVFGNNRIDLNITQEVSSTSDSAGPVNSPSFNNTSVTTALSLEDGATAVIGGLIQDSINESERGIPFMKDIPVLGRAFRVEDYSVDRTELVLLITAYVLRGQEDKAYLADRMSRKIDRTLAADNLVTLRPRRF